jgi:AraC family L-rhamnose operon regulatory protein RhaS
MDRAMELLTGTDLSIREIAFRCGYDSQSQFTAAFRTAYHLAPNDAHKKFRRFL